ILASVFERPGYERVFAEEAGGRLLLLDLKDGHVIADVTPPLASTNGIPPTALGDIIIVPTPKTDPTLGGSLTFIDMRTGNPIGEPLEIDQEMWTIGAANNQVFVSTSSGDLETFDIKTRQLGRAIHLDAAQAPFGFQLSDDGTVLLTVGDYGTVQ